MIRFLFFVMLVLVLPLRQDVFASGPEGGETIDSGSVKKMAMAAFRIDFEKGSVLRIYASKEQEFLFLSVPGKEGELIRYTLFDQEGNIVMQGKDIIVEGEFMALKTSDLKEGIYTGLIKGQGKSATVKIRLE
jgi:hypothetical protein